MSAVIDKVLAEHTVAPPPDNSAPNDRLYALVAKREQLLPVESLAHKQLTDQILQVQKEVNHLNASKMTGCPMIDPVVFSWTRKQGAWDRKWKPRVTLDVPTLAYLSLDKGSVSFSVSWWMDHDTYDNGLPLCVKREWQEIANGIRPYLSRKSGQVRSTTLTYSYPGVIPDHIKQIISEEKVGADKRFTALGLVCDVDRWKIKTVEAPPRQLFDPILVGVKNNNLWVIEAFDPTTLESYLLNEFTA
jgi:hypothetical protein